MKEHAIVSIVDFGKEADDALELEIGEREAQGWGLVSVIYVQGVAGVLQHYKLFFKRNKPNLVPKQPKDIMRQFFQSESFR